VPFVWGIEFSTASRKVGLNSEFLVARLEINTGPRHYAIEFWPSGRQCFFQNMKAVSQLSKSQSTMVLTEVGNAMRSELVRFAQSLSKGLDPARQAALQSQIKGLEKEFRAKCVNKQHITQEKTHDDKTD
jgi:hypothetical protein